MKRLGAIVLLPLLLLCGCGTSANTPAPSTPPQANGAPFTLTFITIGKGDAFLLEAPEGQHYLIDTGKAQDYQQIVRLLRLKNITQLDGIFLSHGHKDHAGCLEPLLNTLPVKRVYISAKDNISYTEINPREILPHFENTELIELNGGESLDLGGIEANVWLPPTVDTKNENNNSMILQIIHGNNRFLFMGDAEADEETAFMHSDFFLPATVLKLGHHGETDATSPAFLDSVSPKIALITGNVEENPDSENPVIAQLLKERQISAYYSKGASIDFCSDGTTITTQNVVDRELPKMLQLAFNDVKRKKQAVIIQNEANETADLTGCTLISERGDEIYHFPEGTTLAPKATLTIVCQDSTLSGDLIWPEDSVWKKHGDNALLYDRNMNILATNFDNH